MSTSPLEVMKFRSSEHRRLEICAAPKEQTQIAVLTLGSQQQAGEVVVL
jgi:hypothetical protein